MKLSDAERWEYSSRKWCSADHEYLKPVLSASWMYSNSLSIVWCSVRTCPSRQCFGWYMFVKMPNSMDGSPLEGAPCADRVTVAVRPASPLGGASGVVGAP